MKIHASGTLDEELKYWNSINSQAKRLKFKKIIDKNLPDIKCNNKAVIGYNDGLYVISGQAYAKTVTTRSATERPFRVKWYGRQCVESTNGGNMIGFSGSSVVPNTLKIIKKKFV